MWVNWCHRGGRDCLCGANSEKSTVLYLFCFSVGGTEQCVIYGFHVCCFPVPYHGVWFQYGGGESVISVYHLCVTGLYVQIRCMGTVYVHLGA